MPGSGLDFYVVFLVNLCCACVHCLSDIWHTFFALKWVESQNLQKLKNQTLSDIYCYIMSGTEQDDSPFFSVVKESFSWCTLCPCLNMWRLTVKKIVCENIIFRHSTLTWLTCNKQFLFFFLHYIYIPLLCTTTTFWHRLIFYLAVLALPLHSLFIIPTLHESPWANTCFFLFKCIFRSFVTQGLFFG